ncbi:MAG: hypothetical protein IJ058_07300 [Lachnospiraceae bacterium]|nr:hypothetical protein [Lachnospiraceae bacterium]
MKLREITEENIKTYSDIIPPDFVVEIRREYCRGLAGLSDDSEELTAAVFWDLKNTEDENVPTEIEILWFYAVNPEDGAGILQALELNTEYDDTGRIFFELPGLSEAEEQAMTTAGYSIQSAESRDVYVTVGEMAALKLSKAPPPDYVRPLSEITSRNFKTGIMTSVFHGKYGLLDDLPFLPMTRYDPEVSCCVQTDDKLNGFLLVHRMESGVYRVELFYAMEPDANVNLLNMLRFSVQAAATHKSQDDRILLRRHNKATLQLIGKLFPGRKGENVLRGERRVTNDL